ncbi:heavy metal sensor histidine kinase [Thiocapsa roseopersicina]|uniref:Sensor protein n=1 Tax=Thiocapsa roseopersicina TaxID=1058 RepID=A0A1H2W880_THIRO|nr:heavy metal sensor histidine kinase [Thiocapsa roseopersicina]SDW76666.1 two-component system, OmpR family, heavy metal sensor histidine kinase CusS [Thiocapsa roseopersicina]
MKAPSLTVRLSLLFAVSTVALLLGLGWTLERSVAMHFRELDQHEIGGKLALVRNLLAKATTPDALASLPADLDAALVGHPGLALRVQAPDGSVRFVSARGQLPPETAPSRSGPWSADDILWVSWEEGSRAFRGLIARVPVGVPLQPLDATTAKISEPSLDTVAIGLDTSHHRAFMSEFRRILVLAMLLAAALAAALGWAVTHAGLRPLRRITALAADLDASRLGARLPETRVPPEIKSLVVAFNAMLARLEDSFQRLSDVSADIAHELRTPISNLTLQTQVALNAARDADQYREVLYSSLEEYERMGQMIGDMLFLARADHGLVRPDAGALDLAIQVQDLFDYFDAWAEERGVSLLLTGSACARADPLMLRRALSNLLSNAIRHTGAGAQVRVKLKDDGRLVRIRVENPGPPIPPEQAARLFERFYRADPARGRRGETAGSGTGLGLAIVKSIVEAHGGAVAAASSAGWTRFTVTLPSPHRHSASQAPAPSAGT